MSVTHQQVASQVKSLGIDVEHTESVRKINQYFQDHKINQLFNVSTLHPI